MKMSDSPAKHEVLIEQYLRSILDMIEILQTPQVFRRGHVNTEKVPCCDYRIIYKNTSESKTSQPCFIKLLRYSARSHYGYTTTPLLAIHDFQLIKHLETRYFFRYVCRRVVDRELDSTLIVV